MRANPSRVNAASTTVRILVIRAWTQPLAPVRDALRVAGIAARLTRVDIEPALNAALGRWNFDLVLHDPTTKDLSREIVEARLREHRRDTPILTIRRVDGLATAIKDVLASRLN